MRFAMICPSGSLTGQEERAGQRPSHVREYWNLRCFSIVLVIRRFAGIRNPTQSLGITKEIELECEHYFVEHEPRERGTALQNRESPRTTTLNLRCPARSPRILPAVLEWFLRLASRHGPPSDSEEGWARPLKSRPPRGRETQRFACCGCGAESIVPFPPSLEGCHDEPG